MIFADLERLLLQLITLRKLSLLGGLDSVDQEDHYCLRYHDVPLESVIIRSPVGSDHTVGRDQLCWILRPSVGHLRVLKLQVPGHVVSILSVLMPPGGVAKTAACSCRFPKQIPKQDMRQASMYPHRSVRLPSYNCWRSWLQRYENWNCKSETCMELDS